MKIYEIKLWDKRVETLKKLCKKIYPGMKEKEDDILRYMTDKLISSFIQDRIHLLDKEERL